MTVLRIQGSLRPPCRPVRRGVLVRGLLALLAGAVSTVAAAGDYYAGRTVRVIIPFSPGGGTDTFGRLVSKHLGAHLPGRPVVIAENVTGAAGVLGSNEFAERAPRDGTTLLTASGHLNLRARLGLQGLRLDLDRLEPLLAAPMGHVTAISARAGVTDATALGRAKGRLTTGLTDPIGSIEAILALELLGVNYRPVPGYGGRGETRIAFERGELMIDTQSTPAYLTQIRPLVTEGRAFPLYAIGFIDSKGRSMRDPAIPDLPTVAEVFERMQGRPPSGIVWEAFRAVIPLVQDTRGTLWAHAQAPPEALAALRTGVARMVQDPAFLADGANVLQGYPVKHGEELLEIKAALRSMPPEVVAWLTDLLQRKFGTRLQ